MKSTAALRHAHQFRTIVGGGRTSRRLAKSNLRVQDLPDSNQCVQGHRNSNQRAQQDHRAQVLGRAPEVTTRAADLGGHQTTVARVQYHIIRLPMRWCGGLREFGLANRCSSNVQGTGICLLMIHAKLCTKLVHGVCAPINGTLTLTLGGAMNLTSCRSTCSLPQMPAMIVNTTRSTNATSPR
jgi:hypothetical protein